MLLLLLLSIFPEMIVTGEEYQEAGASIAHRKC
jgi:actin-related protein